MIKATVTSQSLKLQSDETVSSSAKYLVVNFEFSSDWDGYVKNAVFRNETNQTAFEIIMEDGVNLYLGNNSCLVPFEVIEPDSFLISVTGIKGDSVITTEEVAVEVLPSAQVNGYTPSEPTPDAYQQIINLYAKMNDDLENTKSVVAEEVLSDIKETELSKYVKFTNIATTQDLGVVKSNITNGVGVNTSGQLYVEPADENEINLRQTRRRPIVPYNLDYAISTTILKMTSPPTASTKASFIGQFCVDTLNLNTYQCLGIDADNAKYTWVKLLTESI